MLIYILYIKYFESSSYFKKTFETTSNNCTKKGKILKMRLYFFKKRKEYSDILQERSNYFVKQRQN